MREGSLFMCSGVYNLQNKYWLNTLYLRYYCVDGKYLPRNICHEILVKLNLREHCGKNLTSLTNTHIYWREKREVCCP